MAAALLPVADEEPSRDLDDRPRLHVAKVEALVVARAGRVDVDAGLRLQVLDSVHDQTAQRAAAVA